jgi:VWFA-related protein
MRRLIISLSLAACSAAVIAQTQQPTFRVEANYVRVDMYAMADGQAVEDLRPEEIDLLEDGVPQKVEAFEHVKVRPAGPQETRVEPGTVRDSRALAADPRARVFVIFLDTYHTQVDGSHNMRLPVVRFLDRVIGQDDLVGVMTPEMSAVNLTLGRKTTVISQMMQEDWAWGRREQIAGLDPKEQRYETCYGTDGVAQEMIERRREKLSLDAVEDLIHHLRGLREERKAVLMVSEGWKQFRENPRLARPIDNRVPGTPEVFVGRGGKLEKNDPRSLGGVSMYECEADRTMLAGLDHRFRLMRLTDDANRANVSFYPVYPRGLVPFDAPIGPRKPPPPSVDSANLTTRHDSLRQLAANTDGLSVINTNDIEGAMSRIVADLTSYYLLGYYSSNTKLDGKFRAITVRVKRPGVQVRARRGYRGRTAEDVLTAAAEEKRNTPTPVSKAIDTVAAVSPRTTFLVRTAAWSTFAAGDKTAAAMWIVGELDYKLRKDLAWSAGGVADVVVLSAGGEQVLSKSLDVEAGQGTFSLRVPEAGGVAPGEYAVRVRVRPKQDSGLPVSDVARVIVPETPSRLGEAVLWRRGPTTGPRHLMTADPRFQRSERLRLELATTAAGMPAARMLDRAGNPLQIPVALTDRQDASGEFRWIVVDATLAPLAAGDYAIEVTLDDAKQVTAFKVVP